jgi:hypothetical protein
MRGSDPPPLAVAVLQRFVQDNEPLVGDLIEEFAARRSRIWFWRQVVLAILIGSFQRRNRERPLGLLTDPSSVAGERELTTTHRPRRINLTGSPLPGVGGLGLVALGVLVTLVRPRAWWIFLPAVCGGVVLGVAMVIIRRHGARSGSDDRRRRVRCVLDDTDYTG